MPPVLPKRTAAPGVADGSPGSAITGAGNLVMISAQVSGGTAPAGMPATTSSSMVLTNTGGLSGGVPSLSNTTPATLLLAGQAAATQQNVQAVYTYLRRQQQSAADDSNTNLQNLGLSFVTAQDGSTQVYSPPTAGGTGTRTVFNQGSMVFAGANGVYAQDSGVTYLQATQTLTVANVSTGGTLSGGATTLASLTVGGAASISGNLAVSGAFTMSGNLTVPGTLTVTGATVLQSTLAVTGNSTLSGTLGVTGACTLSSTLAVTGTSTLAAVTASSTVDISSTLRVAASGALQTLDTGAVLGLSRNTATTVLQMQNSTSVGSTQYGGLNLTGADFTLVNSNGGGIILKTGPFAGATNEVGHISNIGRFRIQLGTVVGTYQGIAGIFSTQTGSVGNVGGGGDTILFAVTVPANTMGQNGDAVHAMAAGTLAANADVKSIVWKFAGNAIVTGTTSQSGGSWVAYFDMTRVDSTHVDASGVVWVNAGTAVGISVSLAVADLTANALNIGIIGNAAGSSDVVANMFKVINEPVYA